VRAWERGRGRSDLPIVENGKASPLSLTLSRGRGREDRNFKPVLQY
jgi:hypothetical protein